MKRPPVAPKHEALEVHLPRLLAEPVRTGDEQVNPVAAAGVLVFRARTHELARALDAEPPLRLGRDGALTGAGRKRELLGQKDDDAIALPGESANIAIHVAGELDELVLVRRAHRIRLAVREDERAHA